MNSELNIEIQQFVDKLKVRLTGPLPGIISQQKMAVFAGMDKMDNRKSVPAAVLILIYPFFWGLHTVFMKRTDYDGPHGGQISFPGGKNEIADKNIIETALREAQEEIGIHPADVEVLGILSKLFIPVSNFEVQPVIGFTNSRPDFEIDRNEVNCLIEMRLEDLLSDNCKKQKLMDIRGTQICVPYYHAKGYHIWGATAMILSEFLDIMPS